MGCGSSSDTAVQPLRAGEEKDETESKSGARGDSAVSKGTTDSGVVMESREIPELPGAVAMKLSPVMSVREGQAERVTQDSLLQQESTAKERLKSSQILEELLSQGIIPVGQSGVKVSGAGEAYSIMLDESSEVKRRPPARLESLKAQKSQTALNKDKIDDKMKQVEERRQSREDELKSRLRSKSARVRHPADVSTLKEDEDASFTPVMPLQIDPEPPSDAPPHVTRNVPEGGEWVREAAGDGSELEPEKRRSDEKDGKKEKMESRGAERGNGDGEKEEEEEEEEEVTQVEELVTASGELENDSTFQHAEDNDEIF